MRERISTVAVFSGLCLLVGLAETLATTSNNEPVCCDFSSSKQPLWHAQLDLPSDDSGDCRWTYSGNEMVYVDAQRIVVGLYAQCFHFNPHAPRIENETLLFLLDGASGKVLKRLQWITPPGPANRIGDFQILLTHEGRFLVRAGATLKLISAEFKELHSRTLVEDNPSDWDYWFVRVAPGGSLGFFKRGKQSGYSEDHWFSTDTLEDEQVEAAPPDEDRPSSPVVTSSSVYFYAHRRKGVFVRERGQEARPFCPDCPGIPLSILPDGLLFLGTGPKASFLLLTPQGNIAYHGSYGTGVDNIFGVAAASASPRFAFPFGHLERGFFSWESPETVIVFDTRAMKDIFRLKLKLQSVPMYGGEGWFKDVIALSPDGTRLAVGSRAVLKVFDVSN